MDRNAPDFKKVRRLNSEDMAYLLAHDFLAAIRLEETCCLSIIPDAPHVQFFRIYGLMAFRA